MARGAVRLRDKPTGPGRRPLFGSLDEVREDVDRYRESGLTELFLDLNFDERVAAPGADPDAGLDNRKGRDEAWAVGRGQAGGRPGSAGRAAELALRDWERLPVA